MPQNCRKKKHQKKKQDKNNNSTSPQISCRSDGESETPDKIDIPGQSTSRNDLPYDIKMSDIMGRYLVASRPLKAGELIIQEEPLAIGPSVDSDPVCLGCYQPLETDIMHAYKCPGCKWPLCASNCSGIGKNYGHRITECNVLRDKASGDILQKCDKNGLKLVYEVILPLRCLLLKKDLKDKWDKLMEMESHNDIRKKIPSLWNRNQEVIVNRIRKVWGVTDFTEEEIHTVCGMIEVNCFEIGQNGAKARALYPSAFLLAHDCRPNTTHADHPKDHTMAIRVIRPLKKGDPITLSYAYTFQGTLKRREHLQEGKFFWCRCDRCSDPTELGTYSSALHCPKCQRGIILSTEPLNNKAAWKCKSCEYNVAAQSMFLLLEKMFKDLDSMDPHDIPGLEDYLQRYRNVLTENHYLNISAKYNLLQLYGRIDGYIINELSEECLKRKEKYCRDVLKVVDILEPGLSRLRGVVMYELHAPIMILATRLFEAKRISSNELRKRLREVVKLLQESEVILLMEPEGSNEHTMAIAAKDALERIGPI